MTTSVHNLVMAYMHGMGHYGDALQMADNIDTTTDEIYRAWLNKLENWLDQETTHLFYALAWMAAESEGYMCGVEIPPQVQALIESSEIKSTLVFITGCVADEIN